MRVLILDPDRTGLDMVYRAAEGGHDVKWWMPPQKDGTQPMTGNGFPGVNKIRDWRAEMKWAKDGIVINLFNGRQLTAELDKWRVGGYPIFGPTVKSARLEWERGEGMKLFEKHGMEVPAYHTFASMQDALKFAWKAQEPFVFKPLGDEEDKSLSFVPSDPAELVGWMENKLKRGSKMKGSCILQEKIDILCECGISAWMGKDGFLPGKFNLNFEHKKLMNGDYGQNTGEMGTVTKYIEKGQLPDILMKFEDDLLKLGHIGDTDIGGAITKQGKFVPFEWSCFDEETEVLTGSGWKFFKDICLGEHIATMNPDTEELIFVRNTGVIKKPYVGEMIHFGGSSSAPEFMVTPDHKMWVGKQKGRSKKIDKYQFIDAKDCGSGMEIKRGISEWNGDDREYFVLPAYEENHFLGRANKYIKLLHPEISMPMKSWMGFLGLMLSEGHVRDRYVSISQRNHRKFKIRNFLEGFGLQVVESDHEFRIHSVQLCDYLRSLGWSYQPTRKIPREFMGMSQRHLNVLLDALIAGDGSVHKKNGQRIYTTSSKVLADDVQEIMLKCGIPARIVKNKTSGTQMTVNGSDFYTRNHDMYIVSERRERKTGWLDNRLKRKVQYKGYVYCCEVPPHHLLYVRRNGNASWCGNCRFGWPSTFILFASHLGDPIEWMKDAIKGDDTLEVDTRAAIGVVMAQPPFPQADTDYKSSIGNIVTGIEDVWDHVSPVELMIADGPLMKDGKITKGQTYQTTGDYIACVTALGPDVHDAIPEVYAAADRIKFPNRILRTDIGKRLESELPKVRALGFDEFPEW